MRFAPREKNLWGLLRTHWNGPECHLQRIETGTQRGVPDVNGCWQGAEFWIELKVAKGNSAQLRPEQVAWHLQRARAGGRSWILVRKGDELMLYRGDQARDLAEMGLIMPPRGRWSQPWAWDEILKWVSGGGAW
jgi:Holliday junction resolvase